MSIDLSKFWLGLDMPDLPSYTESSYPRYNLIAGNNDYRIEIAVPGWKKDELKERIQKTLDKTTEASLLRNNLNALLDYMYEVEHDASNSAGWKTAWDFFINRRDKLRGEDFFTAFPEHENMRSIIEHE